MDERMGPLITKRAWSAAEGRHICQIVWTTEQLRRIGQAVEEGDEAFLAIIEEAMCRVLDAALTPQKG
jgi:hypothetical protein